MNRKYGWKRSKPDHRDYKYGNIRPTAIYLPPSMDLRSLCPPVVDQGNLGSCTANALSGAIGFLHPGFIASRLFIYYNERTIENSVNEDNGATLRDGITSLVNDGVCDEVEWPYVTSQFTVEPCHECYMDALAHTIKTYHALETLEDMRTCLAEGFPFVFGFQVYASFESAEVASSGIVPLPAEGEECLGGHAVIAVGYDDEKQMFLVRNSWGTWGLSGYFWIPYNYLSDDKLCSDRWTLRA